MKREWVQSRMPIQTNDKWHTMSIWHAKIAMEYEYDMLLTFWWMLFFLFCFCLVIEKKAHKIQDVRQMSLIDLFA